MGMEQKEDEKEELGKEKEIDGRKEEEEEKKEEEEKCGAEQTSLEIVTPDRFGEEQTAATEKEEEESEEEEKEEKVGEWAGVSTTLDREQDGGIHSDLVDTGEEEAATEETYPQVCAQETEAVRKDSSHQGRRLSKIKKRHIFN